MNEETAARLFRDLLQKHRLAPQDAKAMLDECTALHPKKGRAFQAALLMQAFSEAAALAKACNWDGVVMLRDGEVLVDQDGALLRTDVDDRLFRKRGGSQAASMLRELTALGIEPRTILDVGANIGEIAVYLAHRLPAARVVAFEPAPENLAAFDRNIAAQPSPLANLEVVREAVGDRTGQIEFTIGAGDLNTAMVADNLQRLKTKHRVEVVRVPADTLENHCARLAVQEIDFLKLDTEGGEPLLSASISNMAGRIRAAYVEMSRYNSVEAYLELIAAFNRSGLNMVDRRSPVTDPEPWLRNWLAKGPAVNVWFVRADHLPSSSGAS